MMCLYIAPLTNSCTVLFSSSSLSPPLSFSSCSSIHNFTSATLFHKTLPHYHHCSAILVGKAVNLKPHRSNQLSIGRDDNHIQERRSQIFPRPSGNGGVGNQKRTQEELLNRIAYEERQKRAGNRDATPTVRALTWACRETIVASDVDAIVADLDLPLQIFSSALQKLGIEGRPKAAVAVFQWLQTTPDRLPNVYIYNSLLGALKANRWYATALKVFQQMQANAVVPDIVTYNTLISMYEQQGRLNDAIDLFNNLRALGVQPTLFTFRNVIQILKKKGDVETALGVFKEFKQQEGAVDKREKIMELKRESDQREELERIMTYLCCERFKELISVDRTKGDVALQFLNSLEGFQVRLDAQACKRLVLACKGEGEADHKVVKILYHQMRQQQMRMSVGLCNHVIDVLGRGKKWWAALEVFEHMMQLGPEPDKCTYRLLLSHFHVLLNSARNRRIWKWSLQLLDKMIEKGVEPDRSAWDAALVACAKAGQTAAAVLVFQKMTVRGQRPGIVSYGALLSALEKSDSLPEAELVWEHMRKVGSKPNIFSYTTMIALYGKVGKYSEAMNLVEDMRQAGIEPSVVTFNALITGCARAGDGDRALDLLEQMKAAWIQPDAVSYAQLIEALANEGRWEPATAAYAKMQELELSPPPYVYDSVVRVCKANNVAFDVQPVKSLLEV